MGINGKENNIIDIDVTPLTLSEVENSKNSTMVRWNEESRGLF